MDDGGQWIFPQMGEPFAFEDLTQYKTKRIRDRFTPALLRHYLAEFSAFPYDPDFYLTGEPATRIEKVSRSSWILSAVSRFLRE